MTNSEEHSHVCDDCGHKHESEQEQIRKEKKQSKNLRNKDIFMKSDNAPKRKKIVLQGKKTKATVIGRRKDRSMGSKSKISTLQSGGPQVVSKGKAKNHRQRQRRLQQVDKPQTVKGLIAKKCLLIGINYTGTSSQLNGCINDAENLKGLLKRNKYFNENQITMMTDKKQGALKPTKANILKQFNQLVKFAKNNKGKQVKLFVSYSGHGVGVKDRSNEESDGQDEALCPVDYNRAGFIIDDDIRRNFINKLPSNVKLVMLVDACHSATMLDLKYGYLVDNKNTYKVGGKILPTNCEVVSISGCRDNQTSADAWEHDPHQNKSEAQGAMTASFIDSYRDGISYNDLIKKIRIWLKNKRYAQVPQMTSGKLVDVESRFMLADFN